ncbi:MAG: hypothetical protein WD382_12200 [Halofilum sp. (in: g-proteobacteria)]
MDTSTRRFAAAAKRAATLRIAFILSAWLVPALGWAGGSATIQANSPSGAVQMDIRWDGGGAMRMEMPEQPGAYMLVRDGTGYSVAQQGGRTMVIDMSSIREMGAAGGGGQEMAPDDFGSLEELENTGERETVAGVAGEVYRVIWTGPDGNRNEDRAVLSSEPLALELTRAFAETTEALSGSDQESFGQVVDEHGLGILRFADHFEVVAVSDDDPAGSVFELPAEPMTMQDLMGGGGR